MKDNELCNDPKNCAYGSGNQFWGVGILTNGDLYALEFAAVTNHDDRPGVKCQHNAGNGRNTPVQYIMYTTCSRMSCSV